MAPDRKQLITILAKSQNVVNMGGDAYGMTDNELKKIGLTDKDLMGLPSAVYDGLNHEENCHVFMRSGLESSLGISRERANFLTQGTRLCR